MDFTTFSSLLSSIGFPAVFCLLMYKFINKITDQHTEEMNKMSEALNNNTRAIERLSAKLDLDGDEDNDAE